MAAAPVPAAEMALKDAGLKIEDMKAIKTHNPFIVNDINLSRKLNFDVMNMNNYGSSLVYGHPQGPTGCRLIAELLEEVVMLGGGYGIWAGCAAGDQGASMIFKVS
jgi:acetyl-CoA acetyltransferase